MADPNAAAEIVKSGIVGAMFVFVTIPLALYVRYQSKLLKEANDKWAAAEASRAKDAKDVIEKLLSLNDKWNALISEQTSIVNTMEGTFRENREVLRDVRDELRVLRR